MLCCRWRFWGPSVRIRVFENLSKTAFELFFILDQCFYENLEIETNSNFSQKTGSFGTDFQTDSRTGYWIDYWTDFRTDSQTDSGTDS